MDANIQLRKCICICLALKIFLYSGYENKTKSTLILFSFGKRIKDLFVKQHCYQQGPLSVTGSSSWSKGGKRWCHLKLFDPISFHTVPSMNTVSHTDQKLQAMWKLTYKILMQTDRPITIYRPPLDQSSWKTKRTDELLNRNDENMRFLKDSEYLTAH